MDEIRFAPRKKPWNDDSPANTNRQWFGVVQLGAGFRPLRLEEHPPQRKLSFKKVGSQQAMFENHRKGDGNSDLLGVSKMASRGGWCPSERGGVHGCATLAFWQDDFLGNREGRVAFCGLPYGCGSKNRNSKMGCPGKWKHGPKPAVCPSWLILATPIPWWVAMKESNISGS